MPEQVIQNGKKPEIHYKIVYNNDIGYLRIEIKTHGHMLYKEEWNNINKDIGVDNDVNGVSVKIHPIIEGNDLMLTINLSALGHVLFNDKIKIATL